MLDQVRNADTSTLATPLLGRIASLTLVFIFAFLAAPRVAAQMPREERPLQEVFKTDLVYTQDRGEIQLTTGLHTRWNRGPLLQWLGQTEYGITDRWQLQGEWAGWQEARPWGQPAVSGSGDVSVGTKYSFMNIRGSPFHAAVLFDAVLPSGSLNKDLGEGFLSYTPSLLFARDLPQHHRLQLFTQIGVSFVQRVKRHEDPAQDAPTAHELEWSSGFFVPLRRVVIVSEVSWQTNRWNHNGQINELYLTAGTVWKFPGRWECGAGASFGLTPTSDLIGLQIRFTREFHSREADPPTTREGQK
jgi:hypothetical protein